MSNTDFGFGQMTPFDTTSDYNVLCFIIRQQMAMMSTMKPVKVVAVHPGQGTPPAAGTVDVQPLINLLDGQGNKTEWATIFTVPYFRLQGGKWAVILDPDVGDCGFVICADRDISALKSQTPGQIAPSNPSSFRKYDPADGVYVGGIFNAVPTATFWCKPDGTLQVTDSQGNVISTSSSGFSFTGNVKVIGTLEATKIQTDDQGLTVTGNIAATGTITAGNGGADSVKLQTHTHSGVQTGGGASGPPVAGT
jgi:hypothetical protein